MKHISVLKNELISVLAIDDSSVVFDCTLGVGGHARSILEKLGAKGVYVGIDADGVAIDEQQPLKKHKASVHLVNDNFANIKTIAERLQLIPDIIFADLGWRTDQFEDGNKGFSFTKEEPLLMTFGCSDKYLFTAHNIVNEWEENSIADIIYGYGEERYSRRIAKAIIDARDKSEIKTSKQLADIIFDSVPTFYRKGRIHPATKTFQAIRITVNDELESLKTLLADGFEILSPGGRMAIISFHSLEDRIVKQFFNNHYKDQTALRLIKKPITASIEEKVFNPRSRSAKLRIIEKI